MRRWLCMAAAGVLIGLLLTGCSSNQKANTVHNDSSHSEHSHSYKDGTYTAKSSPDERGAVGEITLTIQQGKIAKADYRGIQKDGKVKDIDYGKTSGKIENPEFYQKAQQGVKGAAAYGPKLIETQNIDQVDSISGATVSHKQFTEAAKSALDQAK
ncbi:MULTISPECIES: FMN-binding protein [Pelosinus]|uniref:FMN-binding domain protein n=1 Tax=Pelosinus fermentans B4 TaxID=1149862 RepID=I9B603_9FIRM|nr:MULTISPECIES: FMN-binding protein [Pelosinus]EIW20562.1 FMN-binding domain protein [Pelosinus fermentans B4]EIW25723.1 FMN-binding domain protein [Pelosinus fermentans A11]OAM93447.1 FMN-binding domain protein [Pelosinus fermentans DSM 17108]SDQ78151.1 Major membrane immunogen, membrane-anchored lipoprotein [Pelosinus fermentans]